MKIPMILDMDPGIDDTIALIYLLLSNRAEVLGLGSVHGNVEAPLGAENALRVFEALGYPDIPVAVGAERPMAQELNTAKHVHGDNGLGNVALPAPKGRPTGEHAVDQLIRLVRERPGEIVIVATGPLTNLGLALLKDPALPKLVKEVVIMGGAALAPGNVTAVAEANIWHDPEAADLVFTAGWPVTMVGLDVTMTVYIREQERRRLRELGKRLYAARLADDVLEFYTKAYEGFLGKPICPVHDPLAVAIALDPTLATYKEVPVRVECRGALTRGMTVADFRYAGEGVGEGSLPRTRVAVTASEDRFLASFFDILERAAEARS